MPLQRFNQALLSEFLSGIVERFGHAVGVENQCISGEWLPLLQHAIPILKQTQNRGDGGEPFQSAIAPEEKGGKMPAIRKAQPRRFIVIFSEEKCRVVAVGGIFVK